MYKQKPLEGVGLRIITNPKKVGQCFQDVLDETQKFVLHISMFPTVLSFLEGATWGFHPNCGRCSILQGNCGGRIKELEEMQSNIWDHFGV